MILRIKPRAAIQAGLPATIGDIANVMCDARLSVNDLIIPMPKEPGIWLVDAGSIMNVIYSEYPHEKITVLGDTIGWVQRKIPRTAHAHIAEYIRLAICGVFARMYTSKPIRLNKRKNKQVAPDLMPMSEPRVAFNKGADTP